MSKSGLQGNLLASDNLDVTSQKKKFTSQASTLARSNNNRITSKTWKLHNASNSL